MIMLHDNNILQFELEDRLNLLLMYASDEFGPDKEDLSNYSKGLCNAFAFLNFRAELIGQEDKNISRIKNLMSMSEEEIVEIANLYHEYKKERKNLTEDTESQVAGTQIPNLNREISELYTRLTALRKERQEKFNIDTDKDQIEAWKKDIELPIENEIRQRRDQRNQLIEDRLAVFFSKKELRKIDQARDLYLYIHTLVGAFDPSSINFTIQGNLVNQYDYKEILRLLPLDTFNADSNLEPKNVTHEVENVFKLGLVLDKQELIQLLENEDIIREGDLISLMSNDHATFISYKNGKLVFYDPAPITIEPNTFLRLVDVIQERLFLKEDLASGFMPIGINVFQKKIMGFESSPRLQPAEVAKDILSNRSSVDTKIGRSNTTSAWMAAKYGQADVIRVIDDVKESLMTKESRGTTPAQVAARHGYAEVIQVLHELGVNLSAQDEEGTTPAIVAAEWGNANVLEKLHKLGVDLNAESIDGFTPALAATQYGHVNVIKTLYELGVDLATPNDADLMSTLFAAEFGQIEVIRTLDELGIDLAAANRSDITPAITAALSDQVEVIKTLSELGIDLTAANASGLTPALAAAEKGHVNVIKMLHDLGVDLNAANNAGFTPRIVAEQMGQGAVLDLLDQFDSYQNAVQESNRTSMQTSSALMHSVLQGNSKETVKQEIVKDDNSLPLDINPKKMKEQTVSMAFFKGAKKDDVVPTDNLNKEKTPPQFKKG
jgi:ankyrin repeat protein